MGRRFVSLLLLTGTVLSANAQSPSAFCRDGQIIIVDGRQECRRADSLARLLSDMEAAKLRSDPIGAGQDGDREALRRLPDVSPEAQAVTDAEFEAFRQRHRRLARTIPPSERLNYDLLGYVLDRQLALVPFDTARIPFTNDSGFFNSLTYLARQTTFETSDDYEAYAARLAQLPRFFGQHQANMRRGIDTGVTAWNGILPGIVEQIKTFAETKPQAHPFYAPFTEFPNTISASEQGRLARLGEAAVKSAVIPAYRDLLNFMKTEYVPAARNDVGIGTTPDQREYYRALVKYYTTLDLSPDQVHQIGLDEVGRIRAEMDQVIKDSGFKGSFKSFLRFLKTDPQFFAKTERELLMTASYLAKKADGQMPEYFGRLPRLPYGVMKVPDEIAPRYTTGRYWHGNPEQNRAGNYVVNTYDLRQRPLYNLPALTLHEGVPGHHHQIALSQELENVPDFRRDLYPTAFGEGWGLYSEKLGEEMGMYTTPYEQFGRLTYEMWRACRLVVDTGMHWKGWSREKAEACFKENSALSDLNIQTEVDRYISWPGQALAYKIGEMKIIELRERAEAALSERFVLRDFHDVVLEDGGVPLSVLETKIDRWIAGQTAGGRLATSAPKP